MLPILSGPYRAIEPGNVFASLRRDVDRLFDDAFSGVPGGLRSASWLPPVDIDETEDAVRVDVEVPGLRAEDLNVTVENGVLTISGEKKFERKEADKEHGQWSTERQYGRFQRSFTLPAQVDADNVKANCADGVLSIILPKRAEARPKRIEIGTSGDITDTEVARGKIGRADIGTEVESGRAEERGTRRPVAGTRT